MIYGFPSFFSDVFYDRALKKTMYIPLFFPIQHLSSLHFRFHIVFAIATGYLVLNVQNLYLITHSKVKVPTLDSPILRIIRCMKMVTVSLLRSSAFSFVLHVQ